MKHTLKCTIHYKDESEDPSVHLRCTNYPTMGNDWVILYVEGLKRVYYKAEDISRVDVEIE